MFTTGRFLRGSLGLWFRVVLTLYVLAAALMPFAHHDLVCHLKSTTHCTTCTVGSSAETAADPAVPASFSFVDAGATAGGPVDSPCSAARRPASGRAPPSFV